MRHFQLFLNNEIGHLLYASSQFYSHLVALARKRVKLAMQDLNTSQNPLIFCSIVAGVTTNFIFYIPSFLCCTLSWNSSNHFRLTKKLLLPLHFCVKCGKKVFCTHMNNSFAWGLYSTTCCMPWLFFTKIVLLFFKIHEKLNMNNIISSISMPLVFECSIKASCYWCNYLH